MKKITFISIHVIVLTVFGFVAGKLSATDRIVQESGPSGTYASITNAVNAASDGDRIVINNRIGNIPWIEDITITKALTFISAVADTFFIVQGNYTVSIPAPGKTVNILGMKNIIGNITSGANGYTGSRTNINIMSCWLTDGNINFDYQNYNVTVSGNHLESGKISVKYGKITGNYIYHHNEDGGIYIGNETQSSSDTIFIVGNKIYTDNYSSSSHHSIVWSNSNQNFYISNNYIRSYYSYSGIGNYYQYAISIDAIKNGGSNNILNNSMEIHGSYYYSSGGYYYYQNVFGINVPISIASGTILNIENNFIVASESHTYGISLSTPSTINCSYNFIDINCGTRTNAIDNGTNVTNLDLSFSNGQPSGGGINAADPNPIYNDLDLTRGDAGAYGGSFSLSNFFPDFNSTFAGGKNRVHFMYAPRIVVQGNNVSIKADSYDR